MPAVSLSNTVTLTSSFSLPVLKLRHAVTLTSTFTLGKLSNRLSHSLTFTSRFSCDSGDLANGRFREVASAH